uniref:Uncharacterized protein n=1 Tax=Arundo donax TaxID=35708 RepID=A0A0A9B5X4_ARUDO
MGPQTKHHHKFLQTRSSSQAICTAPLLYSLIYLYVFSLLSLNHSIPPHM